MIKLQFFLRILVWVVVLGIGYLLFGPGLFDSSPDANPFGSDAPIYLPPAKPDRLRDLEVVAAGRALSGGEAEEYRRLARDHQAGFWQGQGLSVADALADVSTHRQERLVTLLEQRGLSRDEIGVFLMVVQRDRPALLSDRGQDSR